jgi:[acyl-carrier-protein] S-malonyltransferase
VAVESVFLFPGLGAYSAGVLRQARIAHPQVKSVFEEIDEVAAEYGTPAVSALLFDAGPPSTQEMLAGPAEVMQLAIFGTSIATHRILVESGAKPSVLLGHSFGEIAALVSAGAFSLADGVRLVFARAAALREWEGRGAMAAIVVSEPIAGHLIGVLDEPEVVVACLNAPRQTVLSGPIPAITRVEDAAKALGFRCVRLHLPYAAHHPSLRHAIPGFLERTADVRQRPLTIPVISATRRGQYTDGDHLCRRLAEGMELPVHFLGSVRDLHARGASRFVEAGALNALTRCVEATLPGVRTFAPLLDPEAETANLAHAAQRDAPHEEAQAAIEESVPSQRTVKREGLCRAEVLDRLRGLYSEALDYPLDVLTENAHLEADLGVDSLKQTALLAQVADLFELPGTGTLLAVARFSDLGKIADHITGAATATARHEGAFLPRSTFASQGLSDLTWAPAHHDDDYLAHHLLRGMPTMPGAFVAELAAEAATADSARVATSLHELRFYEPVFASTGYRLVVRAAENGGSAVQILSDVIAPDGRLLRKDRVHARADVRLAPEFRQAPHLPPPVPAGRAVSPVYYERDAPLRLDGPFASMADVKVGGGGGTARFAPDLGEWTGRLGTFHLPALLLDAVIQLSLLTAGNGSALVPVAIREIEVFTGLNDVQVADHFGTAVTLHAVPGQFAVAQAPDGTVLLRIDGVQMRKLSSPVNLGAQPKGRKDSSQSRSTLTGSRA